LHKAVFVIVFDDIMCWGRRRGSKLQVRRLREGDAGMYQCQAVNVVGQSERSSVDVVVVPGDKI